MTPKKNDTFSRVRTTFADCHDACSDVTRAETYIPRVSVMSRATG